jgi:hypothetical protein
VGTGSRQENAIMKRDKAFSSEACPREGGGGHRFAPGKCDHDQERAPDLIEQGRPLSFLVISRILFKQPLSTWSENALITYYFTHFLRPTGIHLVRKCSHSLLFHAFSSNNRCPLGGRML